MKQQHQSMLLAGLLAVALGTTGCSGMRGGGESSSGTGGATGTGASSSYGSGSATDASGNPTGSSGSTGYEQSGASGAMGSTASSAGTPVQPAPNSTVLAIEVIPRASAGSSGSAGSTGASGSTGSSGSSNSYRVTLRLDDGSTQVLTQDTTPDFRSGDRVKLSEGVIQR